MIERLAKGAAGGSRVCVSGASVQALYDAPADDYPVDNTLSAIVEQPVYAAAAHGYAHIAVNAGVRVCALPNDVCSDATQLDGK